jgi:hypothetical protein
MTERQIDKSKNNSNPCAAIDRIIAFMAVAFTVCALAKSFACGQRCESCPYGDECGSNNCPCQGESTEAG